MVIERPVNVYDLRTESPGSLRVSLQIADRCKVLECAGEKPPQPDAFTPPLHADAAHAIVPIVRSHERDSVRTRGNAFCERATAVLIEGGDLTGGELPVALILVGLQRFCAEEWDLLIQDG